MISHKEGEFLVKLARQAIETYLLSGKKLPVPKVDAKLRERRGVFVTLTKHGELRGCIGHPSPTLPLVEAVMDAAVSSAVDDPRFSPMMLDELSDTQIEVSVLTPPELVEVKNPCDYPKHIEIGRHGLIVEYAGHAGLLLPQVPIEWGWDAEEFLSQTCMKAGLMPDCWLREGVRISRFSAQIFSEKGPSGPIEERILRQSKG
ncbi:MAG: TIGR00296 family protein [Candidatus Hodarchaeaceae archaeon]|nr:TIGR00296 family protein [Candidatus Hodarchaeaceae archaeon]